MSGKALMMRRGSDARSLASRMAKLLTGLTGVTCGEAGGAL